MYFLGFIVYGVRLLCGSSSIDNLDDLLTLRKKTGLVESDPEGALTGFAEVVRMEPEKAEW